MNDDKWQAPREEDIKSLVVRAKNGDRSAFDMIVKKYANMVTGLAWKYLGSHDEALDCAQDAFVKAWENIERYDPKWSLATWLRRIVTNSALDRLRRRRGDTDLPEAFEEILPSGTERPDQAVIRKEQARSVHDVLEILPEKYKTVLVLRDMEGLEISDIAQMTGTNTATVRWRLHRARALFRDQWAASEGQER